MRRPEVLLLKYGCPIALPATGASKTWAGQGPGDGRLTGLDPCSESMARK